MYRKNIAVMKSVTIQNQLVNGLKTFAFLLVLLLSGKVNAQSKFLKQMGSGLPSQVVANCTDSIGNYYAAYINSKNDSVYIEKWDTSAKSWSFYTKLGLNIGLITGGAAIRIGVSANKLYLWHRINAGANLSTLRVYNGFNWLIHSYLKGANGHNVEMMHFNKRLYIAGPIDSMINDSNTIRKSIPQVVAIYNSSFFTAGFPTNLVDSFGRSNSDLIVRRDTLYMNFNHRIYRLSTSNIWSVYYDNGFNNIIQDFSLNNSTLNILSGNRLYTNVKSASKDTIANLGSNVKLWGFKDKNFLSYKINNQKRNDVFCEIRNGKVLPLFYNQKADSLNIVAAINGNEMYYVGGNKVLVDSVDYAHVAQIIVDSLQDLKIDTLLVRVFYDKNLNGVLDSNDAGVQSFINEFNYNFTNLTDQNGEMEFYLFDKGDYIFGLNSTINQDSCFKVAKPGFFRSDLRLSPKSRDTIDIALIRTSNLPKNIVIEAHARPTARLEDVMSMYIGIKGVDCDNYLYNATVTVTLPDSVVYVNSTPSYSQKVGNKLTYNFTNLYSLGVKSIHLTYKYPFGKFSINQSPSTKIKVTTNIQEDTIDNKDSVVQKIVYSYDPNAKYSVPEGKIYSNLKKVRYTIHFQNEGNDDARRVRVVDTLKIQLPIFEFRMIGSTHPYTIYNDGNVVTWVFDNINLKPKSISEELSKGYLVFDAMLTGDLRIGDSVLNKAEIYFDYNNPIETNYATIVRTDNKESSNSIHINTSFKVYPNPSTDIISIENLSSKVQELNIYDVKGVLMKTIHIDANSLVKLDISEFSSGIYFMKTQEGSTIKIVKQ